MIAAMAENRVIGIENRLPWRMPADLKWFKQQTLGKPIVMGRKTFESFGARPLPKRSNIVVSRNPDYHAEGAQVVESLEAGLQAAGEADEVMVIGGANLYGQALERADRIYLTLIRHSFEGDAWFPELDDTDWRLTRQEDHAADDDNPYPYSFLIYERR